MKKKCPLCLGKAMTEKNYKLACKNHQGFYDAVFQEDKKLKEKSLLQAIEKEI